MHAPDVELSEHTASSSPLWMVSQAPALNALVLALQQHRQRLSERLAEGELTQLSISRDHIAKARAEF